MLFQNDERCVGILDIVPTLGDKIVTKLASAICYIDNEVSKIVEMVKFNFIYIIILIFFMSPFLSLNLHYLMLWSFTVKHLKNSKWLQEKIVMKGNMSSKSAG